MNDEQYEPKQLGKKAHDAAKSKSDEPVEFFATIHYRHYGLGEIEKINEDLQKKKWSQST